MKTTEIDENVERQLSTDEKQSNRSLNPEAKGTVDESSLNPAAHRKYLAVPFL